MKIRWLWVSSLAACLLLAASGAAWAHVVVDPEEVAAGEYEKLTVTVPTEKEVPTTGVRVDVPEGFTVSGVKPVPGWEYEFEEEAGVVTAVAWSGGQIGPREFQEFEMQARTPEEPGDFSFGATQTYEDGSTAEWTGPPDSEEPASVVRVVSGGSEGHGFGAEEEAATSSVSAEDGTAGDLPDTGRASFSTAASIGLFAAGLAVGLMTVVLLRWRESEG